MIVEKAKTSMGSTRSNNSTTSRNSNPTKFFPIRSRCSEDGWCFTHNMTPIVSFLDSRLEYFSYGDTVVLDVINVNGSRSDGYGTYDLIGLLFGIPLYIDENQCGIINENELNLNLNEYNFDGLSSMDIEQEQYLILCGVGIRETNIYYITLFYVDMVLLLVNQVNNEIHNGMDNDILFFGKFFYFIENFFRVQLELMNDKKNQSQHDRSLFLFLQNFNKWIVWTCCNSGTRRTNGYMFCSSCCLYDPCTIVWCVVYFFKSTRKRRKTSISNEFKHKHSCSFY